VFLVGCGAVHGSGPASAPRTATPSITTSPSSVACANQPRPLAVGRMSVVYVTSRRELVLFGGDDATSTPTNGTWVLGAGCWSARSPASSPSRRDSMTSAYDADRDVVVVYGGRSGGPGQPGRFLYDTWTWDGRTWFQASNAGPVLIAPAAAYDPNAKQVIMFGSTAGGEAQTWAWDGLSWQRLIPLASPSGRLAAGLTFDVATRQLLLFGGDQTLAPVGETWTWDGSTWR